MRTTLDFDDELLRAAKRRAVDEGKTLTAVIEEALRALLHPARAGARRYRYRPLVKKGTAPAAVDVADRNALHDLMDGP